MIQPVHKFANNDELNSFYNSKVRLYWPLLYVSLVVVWNAAIFPYKYMVNLLLGSCLWYLNTHRHKRQFKSTKTILSETKTIKMSPLQNFIRMNYFSDLLFIIEVVILLDFKTKCIFRLVSMRFILLEPFLICIFPYQITFVSGYFGILCFDL